MDLILLRHAERSGDFDLDPGLTTRGHAQAQALIEWVREGRWKTPRKLIASPKIRAQQTLAPLANFLGEDLEIWPDLDERQSAETFETFRRRVRAATLEASKQSGCIVLCTHLDWIESFRETLETVTDLTQPPYDSWAPAQYLVLESGDLWQVVGFGRIT